MRGKKDYSKDTRKTLMETFEKRKRDILLKKDKSSKGSWDRKIRNLCKRINQKKEYYTTSSCSGRIIIMIDQEKKARDIFLFTTHDKISEQKLNKMLKKALVEGKDAKFKTESCILHIACKNMEAARALLQKAKNSGWKRSGLISFNKRIILELNSTEKLEFPIIKKGEILVDKIFIQEVSKKANKKLEKSWAKIKKLEKDL